MEMAMSQRSFAVIRPASRAFWWPRLRDRFTPENTGSALWRSEIISQVRSLEPSLTKRMRLSGPIFPAPFRASTLALSRLEVSGSTSSSL